MQNNINKVDQANNEKESFIELTEKRAEEVSKRWRVEVLEFLNEDSGVENYAVRLTSTLKGQRITLLKEDLENNANSNKLVTRLGKIGVIKPSYLKEISRSVDEALYNQQDKVKWIDDINSLLLNDRLLSGVAAP